MNGQHWLRVLCFSFIVALAFAGCKKHVAAAPPPAPTPAPPAPRAATPAPAAPVNPPRQQQAVVTPAAAVRPAPVPAPRADARPSIDQLFRQNVKTIYFDYDKADIRPDQLGALQSGASWLKQQRGLKFTIEGNTDERGSEEYNLALGERRANSIRDFLVREGVDASSFGTTTFGKERPACREETEECYQRNRRGEFALNR